MKKRYVVTGIAYVPFTIEVTAESAWDAHEIVEGMTFDELQHSGQLDLVEEFEIETDSSSTVKE